MSFDWQVQHFIVELSLVGISRYTINVNVLFCVTALHFLHEHTCMYNDSSFSALCLLGHFMYTFFLEDGLLTQGLGGTLST